MFWNKNISSLEYWFLGFFILIYVIYFIKIIYVSIKMKVSARASFLKFLPRLAAFVLLIIALLEPSFGNIDNETKIKASNKNIYFVVDVSKSMDAIDLAPSRLEKVKNEIKKIIKFLPNEKYGIIAFASEAELNTPLSSDTENLKTMISLLNTDLIADSGTNLVDALKLSLEKSSKTNYQSGSSAAIIVFTDGEDFADIDENILNDFKRNRVNLFLVGVGTKRGSIVLGKNGESIKNKYNVEINSKLESEYLKTLVAKTNGKYFEFNAISTPTSEIIKNIEELKGIRNAQSIYAANQGNKYHYPLLLAIVIICMDLLFTIRIFNF